MGNKTSNTSSGSDSGYVSTETFAEKDQPVNQINSSNASTTHQKPSRDLFTTPFSQNRSTQIIQPTPILSQPFKHQLLTKGRLILNQPSIKSLQSSNHNHLHLPAPQPTSQYGFFTIAELFKPQQQQIQSQPEQKSQLPVSNNAWNKSYKDYQDFNIEFEKRIKENSIASQKIDSEKASIQRELELSKFNTASKELEARRQDFTTNCRKVANSILQTFSFKERSQFRIDIYKRFCVKKKGFPEIDDDMSNVIEKASHPYPQTQVLVEMNSVPITRKDLQTLLRLNWLNDEIINFYLNLIVERSNQNGFEPAYTFNTFFYSRLRESGHSSIKRWTRKVDIFKYAFILIPVHLGNHWCLAFINFKDRSISYYDSLGGSTNSCCDILLDYLRDESMDKRKVEFDDEDWRFIDAYSEQAIPQQKNGSDCGVFACTYAEFLTREAELEFSQDDMPYLRRKMIYEIVTKKLLDI